MSMNVPRRMLATGLSLMAFLLGSPVRAAEAADCHVGTYRLGDGSQVDIAPSDDGGLRWRRFDGTTGFLRQAASGDWTSSYGWTKRPDGKTVSFAGCGDTADFSGMSGRRIAFDMKDTT